VTNSNRDKNIYVKQKKTLSTTRAKIPKFSKIEKRLCKRCNKEYYYSKNSNSTPSFCSINCMTTHRSIQQSEIAIKRGFGGVRPSCRIKYKNVILGSSYELILAKSLDEFNIEWTQPNRIQYKDPNGKIRTYSPDFYLPEYNVYLDPKNDFLINNVNPSLGFTDRTKINLVAEQNNIKILILDKTQLHWKTIETLITC
jgi:hypothetical protein